MRLPLIPPLLFRLLCQPIRGFGALAAFCALTFCASAAAGQIEVPVGVGEQTNADFVDPLLDEIARGAGLHWSRERAPMSRVITMTERGLWMGFGLGRTPAREQQLAFSQPVFRAYVWPVFRRDRQQRVERIEQLDGLSVCLGRGASYGVAIDAARGQRFQVVASDGDLLARLRMLMAGRCDVMLAVHRSANPWLLERRLRQLGGLSAAVAVGTSALSADSVHFAVLRGSALESVLPRIDRALQQRHAALQALIDSDL